MFFGKSKNDKQDTDRRIAENKGEEIAENAELPVASEEDDREPDDFDMIIQPEPKKKPVPEEKPETEKKTDPEPEPAQLPQPEPEQPAEPQEDEEDFPEPDAEEKEPLQKSEDQESEAAEKREKPEISEETPEERAAREEKTRRRNEALKKSMKIAAITAGGLAVIYFAGVLFYNSHFFFGTRIGNYNCSNLSLKKAEEHITTGISDYSFKIYEKDNAVETITGEEVGLSTVSMESIEDIKKKQNPFKWPIFWADKTIPIDIQVALNEELLRNRISTLQCVQNSRVQMDGAVAGIYYDENDRVYHVVDDGTHAIVSERRLYEKIAGGMQGMYTEMHMDEEGLYGGLETDDTMNDTLWVLNNCLNAAVTYQRGEETTVVDGGTIHTWLSVGEDYSVNLDTGAIAGFVRDLAALYNTVGGTRTFTSSYGEQVSVSGGDYGWKVDQNREVSELHDIILAGQPVTREPAYLKTAGSHGPNNDLPNTYVEVSISRQHLWYYQDGELIVSSDVVTGNPLQGNGTHTGTYSLKYKERDATLVGEDYETPVKYWMPFNGGEGLHDASWRGAFGGRIYMGGGSHGCVNCPTSTAQTLFEHLQSGVPVIVY